MDTDDLADAAYAIIIDARRVSALLGAELAVSGKNSQSESEFLHRMLEALHNAREHTQDYLQDDDEEARSEPELQHVILRLENAVQVLLLK